MVLRILNALIMKERAMALALSFVLGASSTALGLKAEVVREEFCSKYTVLETGDN